MVLALKLYTLGGLRVSIGDQLVPDLGTRKAEVLLVYLCTQKRPIAREILAEMFWEERAQRRALSNLRVALAALRKALGDYLLVERDTAAVDPQVEVWLDAAQLETQLKSVGTAGVLHTKEEAAALAAALDLYRGAFLEGIYLREARAAEEWLEGEREHLAQYEVCRELLEQARLCIDQQERIKLYQAADRLLMDDAVYIPLFYMLDHWLVRPWVRNWDFWNLRGVILEPH
jgi:DNA-binding SARP family transcriptional activator